MIKKKSRRARTERFLHPPEKGREIISQLLYRLQHRPTWNTRAITYSPMARYGIVLLSVFVAFAIQQSLSPFIQQDTPFLTFFGAIVVSAWFGGLKSGLLATLLSVLFVDFFFLDPSGKLTIASIGQAIQLLVFVSEGILISGLSQSMHNALKKAELQKLELIKSEERFRLFIDTVKDYAIFMLDRDGYVTSWNEGGKRLQGYSESEILGKHMSIFFPKEEIDEGRPWEELKTAQSKGRYESEGWRVRKDESQFFANTVLTALYSESGKFRGFSNVTRDMTSQLALEQRKDEFISVASHELKTPITTIKGFVQLLQQYFASKDEQKPSYYLSKVNEQIDRLTRLVTDLLDVSKIQVGKIVFENEIFDIDRLIEDTVEDIQHTAKKHRIFIKGKAAKKVFADKYRIAQVLINLLTNAIKYSPNANTVIVHASSTPKLVTIGVQDFGVGIPKEDQEKIFDRFFQLSNLPSQRREGLSGLGLGLYISEQIIKRHQGEIWVESEEGKGSTFFITLPVARSRV